MLRPTASCQSIPPCCGVVIKGDVLTILGAAVAAIGAYGTVAVE
jgi:hypothetical protein